MCVCTQALYSAGEKCWGTDESQFNMILCSQSPQQLRLVFEEYRKLSNKTLEQVIKGEFSGDIEDGLLAIGEYRGDIEDGLLAIGEYRRVGVVLL